MSESVVLSFEDFWQWIQNHPNCILNAGTADAALYDDEEFHWHLGKEDEETLLVQVLRGKQLVGELLIERGTVTHVQVEQKGEEEFLFQCFIDSDGGPAAAYFFTLSHEYTPDEPGKEGRWVH